ncbi:hypothetical protein JCM11491_004567 [Sporobolomyces phaffii]
MVTHRAAIRGAAVVTKIRQNQACATPSRRAPPVETPSAGQWVNPYPRESRSSGSIANHVRSPIAHVMPPRVEISDPAVFSHPSLIGDPRTFRFEKPLSVLKKWDSRSESFEKLEHFGKSLLKMTLTELVSNHYASLTVHAVENLTNRLLSRANLLDRSAHYSLSDRLMSDPLANKYLRIAPSVRTSLFYAYAAGIYQQEGSIYATQWIRQCFRSTLEEEYGKMKEELFPSAVAASSPAIAGQPKAASVESIEVPSNVDVVKEERPQSGKESSKLRNANPVLPEVMPLVLLDAHAKQHKTGPPDWKYLVRGVAPEQMFKAVLTVGDKTVEGSGKTKNWARQSAAAAFLGIRDLDTRLFESSLLPLDEASYTPRLYEFLKEFDLPLPQFTTRVNPKSPNYKCTLDVGGKVFVVAGEKIGKVGVRREASRMALDYFNPPHELETRVLNFFRSREYSHSFSYVSTPDALVEDWTCSLRVRSQGEKRDTTEDVAEIRGNGMTKVAARGAAVSKAAEMFGVERSPEEKQTDEPARERVDTQDGFRELSSSAPEVRDMPPHLAEA